MRKYIFINNKYMYINIGVLIKNANSNKETFFLFQLAFLYLFKSAIK